ncbi:hypothetical protein [Kamptonema formosum]|uniref:hypothetical protein n=1 Tax=Kamptonema formosum TaxID=331992 RepID=UPI001E4D7FF3|nr:hypothetical protein [Oscillatoria sp. PCC 10802]
MRHVASVLGGIVQELGVVLRESKPSMIPPITWLSRNSACGRRFLEWETVCVDFFGRWQRARIDSC